MKTALILYNSRTGTTERFANEIGAFLAGQGITADVRPIFKCHPEEITDVDLVLLGCWTSGLMIIFQHPERTWVEFAETLPDLRGKKIILFTTYAVATGSMFGGMRKVLKCNDQDIVAEMKSRDGQLNTKHRNDLTRILKETP